MNRGAIILCGGLSERMGTDKALLPFGDETLLQRVVRLVGESVDLQHIVLVAAADQPLPQLPSALQIVRDQQPLQGPLAALAAGLVALETRATAVFATGCDTPLLAPGVIDQLFAQLGDFAATVPEDSRRLYSLTAVYSLHVLDEVRRQLVAGRRSLHELVEKIDANRIPLEHFRAVDPQLDSFVNLNTQVDYEAALRATFN